MATLNLDDLITINDKEGYTYSDEGHPAASIPQPIYSQDHFTGPELAIFYKTHRGTDLYNTYTVCGWEAGNYHRAENGGPLVEGPQAFMNENGFAVTAHKQEKRERIVVAPGDTVIIRGTEYEVSVDRQVYATLTAKA
ncbi:hypothetical protein [Pseudarthrobacter sp. BIM B-2242]|uniref:hypothetical protein n=1 Tax=Pseudarthrobacter sp. BIM B-2242 TaxID=2772401 RepID=UPI00168ABD80|nr:hypothetical protein [Pseudarthrobacter sp. BIM B-2242]QOD06130.1 hypothetical protein IDT60_21460 [Pseudarthrobacter sp. BIM B-2242]